MYIRNRIAVTHQCQSRGLLIRAYYDRDAEYRYIALSNGVWDTVTGENVYPYADFAYNSAIYEKNCLTLVSPKVIAIMENPNTVTKINVPRHATYFIGYSNDCLFYFYRRGEEYYLYAYQLEGLEFKTLKTWKLDIEIDLKDKFYADIYGNLLITKERKSKLYNLNKPDLPFVIDGKLIDVYSKNNVIYHTYQSIMTYKDVSSYIVYYRNEEKYDIVPFNYVDLIDGLNGPVLSSSGEFIRVNDTFQRAEIKSNLSRINNIFYYNGSIGRLEKEKKVVRRQENLEYIEDNKYLIFFTDPYYYTLSELDYYGLKFTEAVTSILYDDIEYNRFYIGKISYLNQYNQCLAYRMEAKKLKLQFVSNTVNQRWLTECYFRDPQFYKRGEYIYAFIRGDLKVDYLLVHEKHRKDVERWFYYRNSRGYSIMKLGDTWKEKGIVFYGDLVHNLSGRTYFYFKPPYQLSTEMIDTN